MKIDQKHKYQCQIVVAVGNSTAAMSSYHTEFLLSNSYLKRDYSSYATAAAATGNGDDAHQYGLSPPNFQTNNLECCASESYSLSSPPFSLGSISLFGYVSLAGSLDLSSEYQSRSELPFISSIGSSDMFKFILRYNCLGRRSRRVGLRGCVAFTLLLLGPISASAVAALAIVRFTAAAAAVVGFMDAAAAVIRFTAVAAAMAMALVFGCFGCQPIVPAKRLAGCELQVTNVAYVRLRIFPRYILITDIIILVFNLCVVGVV